MYRADVHRIILMGIVVGLLLVTGITGIASAQGGISVGACSQDCQCLTDDEARALWGSGSVKCAEVPCGAQSATTGDLTFTIYSYCYRAQRGTSLAIVCPDGCQCIYETEARMMFGTSYAKCWEDPCEQGKNEVLGYKYCYHGLAPTTGGLFLNTVPSGALVSIDGLNRGTTPVTVSGLSPGSHTATFSLAGYETQTETVSVTAGVTGGYTFGLSPVAQPPAGATIGGLNLNTVPSGAAVSLDGMYQGTTPVTLTGLSPGSHTATFSLAGYQEQTETVSVTAGVTGGYVFTLAPVSGEGGDQVGVEPIDEVEVQPLPETGGISVVSLPSGARVILDGRFSGTTPLDLSGLTPGEHTIRVSLSGYEDQTRTVTVIAGQTTPVPFTLRKSTTETFEGPILIVSASPPNPGPNDLVTIHTEYSLPVNDPRIEIYVNDNKEKECSTLTCEATFRYMKDIKLAFRFSDGVGSWSNKMTLPWSKIANIVAEICPCGTPTSECHGGFSSMTGQAATDCEPDDGCPEYCDNCPHLYNPGQDDIDGDGVGDRCDPCPLFDNEDLGRELWYLQNDGEYPNAHSLWDVDCKDDDKDNIPAFLDPCPSFDNNIVERQLKELQGDGFYPNAKSLWDVDCTDYDWDNIPAFLEKCVSCPGNNEILIGDTCWPIPSSISQQPDLLESTDQMGDMYTYRVNGLASNPAGGTYYWQFLEHVYLVSGEAGVHGGGFVGDIAYNDKNEEVCRYPKVDSASKVVENADCAVRCTVREVVTTSCRATTEWIPFIGELIGDVVCTPLTTLVGSPCTLKHVNNVIREVSVPDVLKDAKYEHFSDGDYDDKTGYVYIPNSEGKYGTAILVYDRDLNLVKWGRFADGGDAWVAIHPIDGMLYTSGGVPYTTIYIYDPKDLVSVPGDLNFESFEKAVLPLKGKVTLQLINAPPPTDTKWWDGAVTQGGDFDDLGLLYYTLDHKEEDFSRWTGLHVFKFPRYGDSCTLTGASGEPIAQEIPSLFMHVPYQTCMDPTHIVRGGSCLLDARFDELEGVDVFPSYANGVNYVNVLLVKARATILPWDWEVAVPWWRSPS